MAKVLIGRVTSASGDKTIVITAQTRKTHPLYKKQYSVSRKYMAHDEKNECLVGDKVSIVETRPLSARKRYRLLKVLERPEIRDDQKVEKVIAPEEAKLEEVVRPKKEAKDTADNKKAEKVSENKEVKEGADK